MVGQQPRFAVQSSTRDSGSHERRNDRAGGAKRRTVRVTEHSPADRLTEADLRDEEGARVTAKRDAYRAAIAGQGEALRDVAAQTKYRGWVGADRGDGSDPSRACPIGPYRHAIWESGATRPVGNSAAAKLAADKQRLSQLDVRENGHRARLRPGPIVRYAGSYVELGLIETGKRKWNGSRRTAIQLWSAKSRRRLFARCHQLSWERWGRVMFVTLTYPKDFPWTGPEVKAHLKALHERMKRRWPGAVYGVWKMEFQKRGAPHLHLAINHPGDKFGELYTRWLSRSWFEVVGSGDERHLRAGTQIVPWRSSVGRYLSGYCAKDKRYQNEAPEGFEGMGRWWGVWGARDPYSPARVVWSGMQLTPQQGADLRRLMARYRASKCEIGDVKQRHRCRKTMARASSSWVVGGSRSDHLANDLITAALHVDYMKTHAREVGYLPDQLTERKSLSYA